MSRSRFLSATSLVVAALAQGGCGDDSCGPGGASDVGLVAGSDMVTLTYGHLTAGANNDCPAADAPAGVVSLTISGTQTDGTGLVTLLAILCIAGATYLHQTTYRHPTDLKMESAGAHTPAVGGAEH